jgi:hypothetical protein
MPCGCNKSRSVVSPPTERTASLQTQQQTSPVMYDVYDGDGALVASFSNPVSARSEARRTSGNMVPRANSVSSTA